ncbi:hypothetical protein VTN77DRAFT_1423 [Rasamsonia byssochlamydoides]|uniref:uncharacterized protein n=1 Tax=Rasamsonia byssochlamydoides TaxID=89139 RepID=UPI003742EDE9
MTRRVIFGPGHAIGHQLTHATQGKILAIFNEVLQWQEPEASDAVWRFVKTLSLPTRLSEVKVSSDKQIRKIVEMTLTDVLVSEKRFPDLDGFLEIQNMAR